MDISIVVPAYNEDESLPELCAWIERVCVAQRYSYEIIIIDDGSSDTTWETIAALSQKNNAVKGIRFRRNYGKSPALNEGFAAAQGAVVITMDADLQDSPDEIPALYDMIRKEGYDMVSGWKKVRHDPLSKTLPSKLFNGVARRMTGIPLHDFNCGLKAYRLQVVKSIELFGEMHRYIPALAKWSGFKKIGEKVVQHQARKYGTSKFGGWDRGVKGFLDLLTLMFIGKFGKKPMHLFGALGSLFFLAGGGLAMWLIIEKLLAIANGTKYRDVTEQTLFYLGLTAAVIGIQLFLAGFLGELIARSSTDRNRYLIEERIGLPVL